MSILNGYVNSFQNDVSLCVFFTLHDIKLSLMRTLNETNLVLNITQF